ncbi:hypothetical protein NHX12_022957 [Muraenolepis orangiensis]|uniref:RING-type domain-containing protein n=1 Tax=Muraenolepis orangiensis TaxID=630683 RepID=A0A9Q0EP32_9TELE|nr:hypothetical protein NHX12_022957 [Muraenolepis orangiensis]
MHTVKWCNGCLCGTGTQSSDFKCNMNTPDLYHLPLNIYIIVVSIALFVFLLSLLFCCYLFRRQQSSREQHGYEVVLKGTGKILSLVGQTCAVCLEEFCSQDELGVCLCSHAFHKQCLLKWLEIRSVCPMCNKPISRLLAKAEEDVLEV